MPSDESQLSTNQIQAAFTPQAGALLDAAETRSRSGSVDVDDLIWVLWDDCRAMIAEVLPQHWCPPSKPCETDARNPRPVSHSPSLRALLTVAYRIGIAQADGDPPFIDPTMLWAAATYLGHVPTITDWPTVCRHLGLSLHPAIVPLPPAGSPHRLIREPTQTTRLSVDQDALMDAILAKWLMLQQPNATDNDVAPMEELHQMVIQVERLRVKD